MKSFVVLALSVALLAACEKRPPMYRANVKLLMTYATTPTNDVRQEERKFLATQVDILKSQTMLRRVQQRLKKTPDDIRENLTDLQVSTLRNSSIIMLYVDSPSADFAKDFANALAEEYLKFRDEKRIVGSELEAGLVRLGQELKANDEKLAAFEKQHNVRANVELSGLKSLYEERERIRDDYNAQVAKVEAARSSDPRTVSILEPAIVEVRPVSRIFFNRN
jgi:uncharacterized protein involved in exopolysaccharide biosynthesis